MPSIIKTLIALVIIITFNACQYAPYIKYHTNVKGGFPKFSEWDRFVGDNNNPLRSYDIKKYVLDLDVSPEKKYIYGRVTIGLQTTAVQDTLMFDLSKKLKLKKVFINGEPTRFSRKKDVVFLLPSSAIPERKWLDIDFDYEGVPVNIMGEGPIQWKKDSLDRPHISTQTEGVGPHLLFPCNQLLKDEADVVNINITVPKGLKVVANGKLVDHQNLGNKERFSHSVTNSMNIYNISFNIGHFEKITYPYTDIYGQKREIEFHVLDYNLKRAKPFYKQSIAVMGALEELYGSFPWWNDGCKFVESTFAAMEHQSGIALGIDYDHVEGYNQTLIHELAHEWWGNAITGEDYCDAWIHEGLATYSEAIVMEKLVSENFYKVTANYAFPNFIANKIPIHKECGVLYNSWVNGSDQDIYLKGAALMHSLRMVMNNDQRFFETLKRMLLDWKVKNVSTSEFIEKFNQYAGDNYTFVFISYLESATPPTLHYEVSDSGVMKYRWKQTPIFPNDGIHLKVGENKVHLYPSEEIQELNLSVDQLIQWQISESFYFQPQPTKFKDDN